MTRIQGCGCGGNYQCLIVRGLQLTLSVNAISATEEPAFHLPTDIDIAQVRLRAGEKWATKRGYLYLSRMTHFPYKITFSGVEI